jgi:hypothetical protein
MTMKKPLLLAAALFLIGLPGLAPTADAGQLKDRQATQHRRIQQGLASGQLTPAEVRRLFRDQRQLRQLKRHFLADGRLSGRERTILGQRLDRSSERIFRYKHNPWRVAGGCRSPRPGGSWLAAWR